MRAQLGLAGAMIVIVVAITPAVTWAAAVPIASLKVLEEPSLALRAATARQAGLGRDQHVEVAVECYPWIEGRLAPCEAETPSFSDSQSAAAVRMAEGYRVELPEGRRPTNIALTVRIAWPVGAAEAPLGEPVDLKLVTWTRRPRPDEMGQFFTGALNSPGTSLSTLCRIMEDLSVSCLPPMGDDEGGQYARGMERYMLTLRSAPTLTDGRPAAGQWIRQVIRFQNPNDQASPK